MKTAQFNTVVLILTVCLAGCIAGASQEQPVPAGTAKPAATNRWEKAIQSFEEQDKVNLPPAGSILFVGSSSIRMWNLDKYFPDMDVINRGFGGSQIADSIHYADRIIIKYRPKTIVFYAGDNDIAVGKSAQTVASDFDTFVDKIRARLPETRILMIAIKPSIARWHLAETMQEANGLIEAHAKTLDRVEFIDVWSPMIGDDGKPNPDLFIEDGLHLNHEGYTLWTSILKPHLMGTH